jgi:mRNA-degrading endonuclease RelE of RelBE toxin-antitoxin system
MIFVESSVFTADVKELLNDEEYSALQAYLVNQPDAGDLIKQTGGLRKVRWTSQGRGKRGGTRVIYYHVVARSQIRMILIYRKGIKDDLTPKEKAVLRRLNEEWQR